MLVESVSTGASVVSLASLLVVSSLPSSLGTMERRIFPLPVLHDNGYDVTDVIMRPTKATRLSINATLYDLDTNTTICDLSSSWETEFRIVDGDGDCNTELIDKGYSLVTSADASVYINRSGIKSQIPSVHTMGERYIFPGDYDKRQTDHTKSLLIYPTVKNTTVSVCFDRFGHSSDGHFSAKFTSRLQNWIDGTFMCYRANLARDEIWMINNVAVPGGVEVGANNPVGVLRVHLANTSHGSQNGQFMADPETRGSPISWDIYPPIKFWGRQFIIFPRERSDLQNIFIIAENDTIVMVNVSGVITKSRLAGRKVEVVSIPPTNHVTLIGTSKFMVYSVGCAGKPSPGPEIIYHVALDSFGKLNSTLREHEVGINIVCSGAMETWAFHGENTTKIDPYLTGQSYIGNDTFYFASFPTADMNSVIYVNLTSDQCYLHKTLNSGGCGGETNITANTNNIIKNTSHSVKFDKTHPRFVSEDDLSGSSSRGVIGVHIYDNVNKSGGGNLSDAGLNGNKTGDTGNGSDEQIAGNQTQSSYLPTMTEARGPSSITPVFTNISVDSETSTLSATVTPYRGSTETSTETITNASHVSNETTDYRTAEISRSNISSTLIEIDAKESASRNGTEIIQDAGFDRMGDRRHNKSYVSASKNINSSNIPNQNVSETIGNKQTRNQSLIYGEKRMNFSTDSVPFQDSDKNTNISKVSFQNETKDSKTVGAPSNDSNGRFKVVLDILSSGNKNSDIHTRLLHYEEKNPTYIHHQGDGDGADPIGDGKSLVAVIVSLSSAVLAVIAIILVFFFIEFFSRRKQHRTTRIRPFLSDF